MTTTDQPPASRPLPKGPLHRLSPDEPIPEWVWHTEMMLPLLAKRDIGAMFRILHDLGLSQRRIAERTGQSQSEISAIFAGRRVVAYDLLARIADHLAIPRGLLGLAHQPPTPPAKRIVLVQQCERCTKQPIISTWSGREVRLLREAMRLTVRDFAAHLGISDRMVSKWESGDGRTRPRLLNQAALDTTLRLTDDAIRRRFAVSLQDLASGRC